MPQSFRARSLAIPFACFALLCTASCGKSPKDKLVGKWIGDRIENVSADDAARAIGWVKGTMFELTPDKLTVTVPTQEPRTGTYKIGKVDGDKVTIAVAREGGADEAKLTLADPRTIRWDIGHNREIVLVRAD